MSGMWVELFKIFVTLLLHYSHISSKITNAYGNTDGPNILYLSPLPSPVGLVIEAWLGENGVCV